MRAPTTHARAERVISRCRLLAEHTEVPGEITRRFLSPPMHAVHALLRSWMESAGMSVTVDAVGNLRALYPAAHPGARRLLLGSHLDTVPNAGAFDGIFGVVLALAAIDEIEGRQLPYAIEVLGFSEEEGVRFGKPFFGSLAVCGRFDDALLSLADGNGITVADAIRDFGLDPDCISDAQFSPDATAYLEVHIEQGPVLEAASSRDGRAVLGIVNTIAGQTRLELTFTGRASHAGTTPMALRADALAAAAEWVTAVEAIASAVPGLVATVGRLEVAPGVSNVVPALVCATLDVRHANDAIRQSTVETLLAQGRAIAQGRGIRLSHQALLEQQAVAMDSQLAEMLAAAVARAGHTSVVLASGAGHDAMVMASRLPAAMLFVATPDGVSHHPEESVMIEDVSAALDTLLEFLERFGENHTHA